MNRHGYTVVEVCVAITLLALIVGPVLLVALSGSRYYTKESSRAEIHSSAETAIHKMTRELMGVRLSTILPNPTGVSGSPTITFQTAAGMAGGAVVLGPVMRLALEYEPGETNDGLDNDGDGLIDECQVRWTRNLGAGDETQAILCTAVREYLEGETLNGADQNGNGLQDERGFHVALAGSALTLRLTLEDLDQEGQLVTTTVESAVIALD
jgi:hypothetical protein